MPEVAAALAAAQTQPRGLASPFPSQLIAAQKARNAEELQRPFGAGFLAFLKASKPEIINIFFAFVCVLLAYQIHGMRAGMKKLLAAREEKEADIVRLRGILSELCAGDAGAEAAEGAEGDTFSQRLALKCAGLVREMFEESESRAGYGWILGKKLARVDSLESQRLVDDLHPLLLAEMRSEVGDAAFTPEEMRERRVAALQAEGSADGGHGEAARVGDLMQVLEQVHDQDLADGTKQQVDDVEHATTTTVRRARYAI